MLGAIPGLDALIEGHLRTDSGRALLKTIKDTSQQDILINRWQQSTVFKTFFPNGGDAAGSTVAGSVAGGEDEDDVQMDAFSESVGVLTKQITQHQQQQQLLQPQMQQLRHMSPSHAFSFADPLQSQHLAQLQQSTHSHMPREATSLSDIVAKDAARAYVSLHLPYPVLANHPHSSSFAFQTLAPLGFAPNETIADFYDMGSNPEINQATPDFGNDLGTDAEQRVYYELLMGRSFGDPTQP